MRYELKNWKIDTVGKDENYFAWGNVYNNPRFSEGYNIHTSMIVNITERSDGYEVQTNNSVYFLGKGNSFNSNEQSSYEECEYMRKLIGIFEEKNQRMFRIAEKLLSPGDVMIYKIDTILYSSPNGIVLLKKDTSHVEEYGLTVYSYCADPDSECSFEMVIDGLVVNMTYDDISVTKTDSTGNNNIYCVFCNSFVLFNKISFRAVMDKFRPKN